MTKEQVLSLLKKKNLYIDDHFCDEYSYLFTDQLKDIVFPFEYSIENGVSKIVLLIKGASFVIKIPFQCWWNGDGFNDAQFEWEERRDNYFEKFLCESGEGVILAPEDYRRLKQEFSKENPPPDSDSEEWFYPFEGADSIRYYDIDNDEIPSDWDYCNLESIIYKHAVKRGLGAYFAEEGLLGVIGENYPVYYQTRCTPMCNIEVDCNSQEYKEKCKTSREICKDLQVDCFNSVWIADFVQLYGKEEFARLNDFLREYEIGDLRSCNIGYLDGAPILFDYSGYREWDS